MFKKNDILPLILAAISTALIVGLGYFLLAKINTPKISDETKVASNSTSDDLTSPVELDSQLPAKNSPNPREVFVIPAIVPEGTAVSINGSSKMARINQALSRSFHRQFPGTAIDADADGNTQGINLLTAGEIDVAAIDRPLNAAEQSAGLAAIKIRQTATAEEDDNSAELYYVYQRPATAEVEAFLGFVLSPQGQETINRQ